MEILLSTVQKQWGYKALHPASTRKKVPVYKTGVAELDELLIDGIPTGCLSEFVGLTGSGVTTAAYKTMVTAQENHQLVIFLDYSQTFDADYAQACGINQDELLLIRSENLQQIAVILRDLLALLPSGLFVINGRILDPKDILVIQKLIWKIGKLIPSSQCAVLFLSPFTSSAYSPAHVRVRFEHQTWCIEHQKIVGHQITAQIVRHPASATGQCTTLTLPMKWSAT